MRKALTDPGSQRFWEETKWRIDASRIQLLTKRRSRDVVIFHKEARVETANALLGDTVDFCRESQRD